MSGAKWTGDTERKYYGIPRRVSVHKSNLFECREELLDAKYGSYFDTFPMCLEITVLSDDTNETIGIIPVYCDGSTVAKGLYLKAFRQDNTFNYSTLDGIIFKEKTKDKEKKIQIAMTRLMNPYELTDAAREGYKKYLSRHVKELAKNAIYRRDLDTLAFFYANGFIKDSNIKEFIDYSISVSATACTAYLLEHQSGVLESGASQKKQKAKIAKGGNKLEFEYKKINGNEIRIDKYIGDVVKVKVPDEIDGCTVTTIGESAFKDNELIKEVYLPDSINILEDKVFSNCSKLQKVHLSNRIKDIEKCTFEGCKKLKEINIPDDIEVLGPFVFIDSPLKSLHIGKANREILRHSFFRGEIIQSRNISTWDLCWVKKGSEIQEITIDPENTNLMIKGTLILSADGKTLLTSLGKDEKVIVPEGVEVIAEGAFAYQCSLKEVVLPESLELIGAYAFVMTQISSVILPNNVKEIGGRAFEHCRYLREVKFNSELKYIHNFAFREAPLTRAELPKDVQLDEFAFASSVKVKYKK